MHVTWMTPRYGNNGMEMGNDDGIVVNGEEMDGVSAHDDESGRSDKI